MFEDQLFLTVSFKHHGILVERTDAAGQLHPAHQVDRDIQPLLTGCVEEGILNVLRRLAAIHKPISFNSLTCDNTNTKPAAGYSNLGTSNTGGQPASSQPGSLRRAA